MDYPWQRARADEDVFPRYLKEARALLAERGAGFDDRPTGLSPDFEALRWFPLPSVCLGPSLPSPPPVPAPPRCRLVGDRKHSAGAVPQEAAPAAVIRPV